MRGILACVMEIRKRDSRVWAAPLLLVLLSVLLPGCSGHKSSSQNNSKTAGGSKDEGKVYAPDSKSSGGGKSSGETSGNNGSQGGGGQTQLPSPADTSNGRASVASDAGSSQAIKGQAVMNPGAPVENQPKLRSTPKP